MFQPGIQCTFFLLNLRSDQKSNLNINNSLELCEWGHDQEKNVKIALNHYQFNQSIECYLPR